MLIWALVSFYYFLYKAWAYGGTPRSPAPHSAVEGERCNARCDLWIIVSLNNMQTLTNKNVKCRRLKLASLVCGWETAVQPYVQKCWGVSRAKETMVQEARTGFCQLTPLGMDARCLSYLWKTICRWPPSPNHGNTGNMAIQGQSVEKPRKAGGKSREERNNKNERNWVERLERNWVERIINVRTRKHLFHCLQCTNKERGAQRDLDSQKGV